MAIPDSIKSVKRPSNTRVKNINGKYIVISRTSVRDGKRIIPIELGTIGEIVDGRYVAYPNPNVRDAEQARKDYREQHSDVEKCRISAPHTIKVSGPIELVNNLSDGLLQELTDVFGIADAKFIYTVALLRAAFGKIKNRDLDEEYEASMASVMYPGIPLSKETVSATLKRLGYNTLAMIKFWKARVKANMEKGVVIVEGGLIDFNPYGSNYSEFSRKGMVKCSKNALVLTAYSLELQEPICEELYPGDMSDMEVYEAFSKTYGLDNAVVIARYVDPGELTRLRNRGDRYIVKTENNRSEISEYRLNNPCEYLKEFKEEMVMYKKVKASEDKYFYAFKSSQLGYTQNAEYAFKPEKYNELIVFESNLDLDAYTVYDAYDDRWKIDTYEKLRESIMENGAFDVQSDPSTRATIFVNSISNIMGCRLRRLIKETGVSKTYSTEEVLRKLRHFMKQMDDEGNWQSTAITEKNVAFAESLGII